MIEIVVVGYGNLGKGVVRAVKNTPDMKLYAIYTRRVEEVRREVDFTNVFSLNKDLRIKGEKDKVAILCGGSGRDLPKQMPMIARQINAVCSYDRHSDIARYLKKADSSARAGGNTIIVSAGWDPGLLSMMRVLFSSFAPCSNLFTFWGEGVSQGHSNEAKKVEGVLDARQYTIPLESAVREVLNGNASNLKPYQMHKRLVYVVPSPYVDKEKIRMEIKSIPDYFRDYPTEVIFISKEEMEKNHSAFPHGGTVISKSNEEEILQETLEFKLKIDSNPDFTAKILVACARAIKRMHSEKKIGAFTMLDIPIEYFSPYGLKKILREGLI